jgi:hypothetical protein
METQTPEAVVAGQKIIRLIVATVGQALSLLKFHRRTMLHFQPVSHFHLARLFLVTEFIR